MPYDMPRRRDPGIPALSQPDVFGGGSPGGGPQSQMPMMGPPISLMQQQPAPMGSSMPRSRDPGPPPIVSYEEAQKMRRMKMLQALLQMQQQDDWRDSVGSGLDEALAPLY